MMFKCSICSEEWNENYCPNCNITIDRDKMPEKRSAYRHPVKERETAISGKEKLKMRKWDAIAEKVYNRAAYMLIDEKKTPAEVERLLVSTGVDKEFGILVISDIWAKIQEAKKKRARKDVLIGSILFTVGLFVSLGTYLMANDAGGGTYLVLGGPIIGGGFLLLRGLMMFSGDDT